jgi:hypothetical protein
MLAMIALGMIPHKALRAPSLLYANTPVHIAKAPSNNPDTDIYNKRLALTGSETLIDQ